ncbi:MAG: hypothetical protein U0670_14310 [Anaerolineae bacterium]
MDEKLFARYLEYASTDQAKAILFVKKNMPQSTEKWVDIISCERYEASEDKLHFRFVEYGLYKRILKPKYPPKSEFTDNGGFDEESYYTAVRAITWEVANLDIEQQKAKRVVGEKYRITGVRYNKNQGKYRTKPPWLDPDSAFYGTPPQSIRWRERRLYEYEPEWVYEIKSIKKLVADSDRKP